MKVEHDRAFSLGKNAGYEERKKHVQVNQDHFYNRGHAEGYQKGLDEKAMRYVTDIFTVRKTSKEEGYQEGYKAGRNEVVSAVVNTINNLKHTTGGIPK